MPSVHSEKRVEDACVFSLKSEPASALHAFANPDRQPSARQPDDRISHVIVGQMHLKRPGSGAICRQEDKDRLGAGQKDLAVTLTVTVQIEKNRIDY